MTYKELSDLNDAKTCAVTPLARSAPAKGIAKAMMTICVTASMVALPRSLPAEDAIDFARDIQPILAKHCLLCHGPDDAEGGLQLHTQANALAVLESGEHAIVPGEPSNSAILERVKSGDPDLQMPPEGERLSTTEIETLQNWIRSGAEWSVHWAYRPLVKTELDEEQRQDGGSILDQIISAKLRKRSITPSAEASPSTLIKRLYYDLVGLPPTPSEAQAFVNDSTPEAYERLVDRLLASRHFGERWGRHWLDKARYADSDGYEKDRDRPNAWRYRDWVIHAINQDLPLDQFTIEQLAGDLLPNATQEQRLATAFHRQTLTNTEGGVDKEQFRVAAVMDRTETLGTVWLGLSVGCARCHSHKYDQISQSEYYELYAFFNNADEVDTEVSRFSHFDSAVHKRLAEIESRLADRKSEVQASVDSWLPKLIQRAKNEAASMPQYFAFEKIHVEGPAGVSFKQLEDGSILVSGANPDTATYFISVNLPASKISGLRLEVLPDESLAKSGPGRTPHGNFVLNEIKLLVREKDDWREQKIARATADFSQSGWPAENAIDGKSGEGRHGTGWAISPKFGKGHRASFVLEKPITKSEQPIQIQLIQEYGSQHTIGRFRLSAMTGKLPTEPLPKNISTMLLAENMTITQQEQVVAWFSKQDSLVQKLSKQLEDLRGKNLKVRIVSQRKSPRDTHILRRGEFKQPLGRVTPGTLSTLPPLQSRSGETPDRLDLARWLVDGHNPLPPRVMVNQIWKHLFGEGIVPTMNDFGVRGDPPSHADLLDHLASKLIELKWSRKSLIKYIVMSAAYKRSSNHRPDLEDIDPENRLLYRQNRFRVEAEIIRDITLAASDLLSRKTGGPSVFPPIPPGVTDQTYNSSFKWKTSTGEDRYRRGMYTYFKRTAPHPNLITFDCPDSNITNVDRDRSNTPIAALVTLNNQTYVEAARAMALHVLSLDDLTDDTQRLQYALQRCIVREPSSDEVSEFAALLQESRRWYSENGKSAKDLLGQQKLSSGNVAEVAAWVATLRIILNLDEFLTRD